MLNRLSAAMALVLVGATPVFAQINVPGPISTADGKSAVRSRRPPEEGPAALPGARAEPGLNAPAERSSMDLPPTEALFDSINRGDIASAREAIGRGADIHGRNVLGLTPLEQSVDLGRNDISFLLLSLRGGEGYGAARPPRVATADTPAQRRAEAQAEARARRQLAAETRASRAPVLAAPARNPHLFAGDGGAPVPQAGFLGFDSAR